MFRVFTSIAANYLPKACVLAATVKRFHPDAACHLVLADRVPADSAEQLRWFDTVWTLADLPLPGGRAWVFQHNLVELCTAIKGVAARKILHEHGGDLFYFDPDIAVLGPLDGLLAQLDRHPILLTPHLTRPEATLQGVEDNEICALRHGVFNLGFLGLKACTTTGRFLDWWADRLLHYCWDYPFQGLFTDQRWIDLAPVFFPEVGIIREPQYNVATWNLSQRRVAGTAPFGLTVEGTPVAFFHFSGIDSGGQAVMLMRSTEDNPALWRLRQWYLAESDRQGQERYQGLSCVYNHFDDGTPITTLQRWEYRHTPELQAEFPDPYATSDPATSYLDWWRRHRAAAATPELDAPVLDTLRRHIFKLEANLKYANKTLCNLQASRRWRLLQRVDQWFHWLRQPKKLRSAQGEIRRVG